MSSKMKTNTGVCSPLSVCVLHLGQNYICLTAKPVSLLNVPSLENVIAIFYKKGRHYM